MAKLNKDCSVCKVTKTTDKFYIDKRSGKLRPFCKECSAAWTTPESKKISSLKYRTNNRLKLRRSNQIYYHKGNGKNCFLKRKYGLGVDDYNILFAFQNGVCAGCGNAPKTMPLNVDHLHKKDFPMVRGLLCFLCNKAVGLLRDSPQTAERIAKYLRRPPSLDALGMSKLEEFVMFVKNYSSLKK